MGDFRNNKFHGFGWYVKEDDQYFHYGEWLNGIKHGEGYEYKNNYITGGEWKNGKLHKKDKLKRGKYKDM